MFLLARQIFESPQYSAVLHVRALLRARIARDVVDACSDAPADSLSRLPLGRAVVDPGAACTRAPSTPATPSAIRPVFLLRAKPMGGLTAGLDSCSAGTAEAIPVGTQPVSDAYQVALSRQCRSVRLSGEAAHSW